MKRFKKWIEFSVWLPWMTWEVGKVAAAAWYRLFIFGLALVMAGCMPAQAMVPTKPLPGDKTNCEMTLSVTIEGEDAVGLNLHSDCMSKDILVIMHDSEVSDLIKVLLRSQADQSSL